MPDDSVQQKLEAAVARKKAWLDGLVESKAITGYGIGLDAGGRVAVKVHTNRTTPEVREQIRAQLGDHPVAFEEHGEARAQGG